MSTTGLSLVSSGGVTKSLLGSNAEGEVYVGEEAPEGEGWTQDEDVLDTWFSSALWPFSTMAGRMSTQKTSNVIIQHQLW